MPNTYTQRQLEDIVESRLKEAKRLGQEKQLESQFEDLRQRLDKANHLREDMITRLDALANNVGKVQAAQIDGDGKMSLAEKQAVAVMAQDYVLRGAMATRRDHLWQTVKGRWVVAIGIAVALVTMASTLYTTFHGVSHPLTSP